MSARQIPNHSLYWQSGVRNGAWTRSLVGFIIYHSRIKQNGSRPSPAWPAHIAPGFPIRPTCWGTATLTTPSLQAGRRADTCETTWLVRSLPLGEWTGSYVLQEMWGGGDGLFHPNARRKVGSEVDSSEALGVKARPTFLPLFCARWLSGPNPGGRAPDPLMFVQSRGSPWLRGTSEQVRREKRHSQVWGSL